MNTHYTISNQSINTNKSKQTHNIQMQISKHTLHNLKSIYKHKQEWTNTQHINTQISKDTLYNFKSIHKDKQTNIVNTSHKDIYNFKKSNIQCTNSHN